LPLKRSRGQFLGKYHFSPVKNIKKVQGTRFEHLFTGKITGFSPVRLKLQTPLYSPSNNATNVGIHILIFN
jgi:hypothetical protein